MPKPKQQQKQLKHWAEVAARSLIRKWNEQCKSPDTCDALECLNQSDVRLLESMIAERFRFYVKDGIEFATIPREQVTEAIESLREAVGDLSS